MSRPSRLGPDLRVTREERWDPPSICLLTLYRTDTKTPPPRRRNPRSALVGRTGYSRRWVRGVREEGEMDVGSMRSPRTTRPLWTTWDSLSLFSVSVVSRDGVPALVDKSHLFGAPRPPVLLCSLCGRPGRRSSTGRFQGLVGPTLTPSVFFPSPISVADVVRAPTHPSADRPHAPGRPGNV